jgi:hypothetical protein
MTMGMAEAHRPLVAARLCDEPRGPAEPSLEGP